MDTELIWEMGSFDGDAGIIFETITLEIASFFLFVVVIVRSDDIDLFSKSSQLFGQLINHDS